MTLTREELLLNVKVSLKSNDPKQKQKSINRWNKFKTPTYTNLYDELPNDLQWYIQQIIYKDEQKPMDDYIEYIKEHEQIIKHHLIFDEPIIINNSIFERKLHYQRLVRSIINVIGHDPRGTPIYNHYHRDKLIMDEIILRSTNKLIDMERKKGLEYPNVDKLTKPKCKIMYERCGYRFINFNRWKVDKVKTELNKKLKIIGSEYSWDGIRHTADIE